MISLEQKVKFILYGFGFFFAGWCLFVYLGIADKDDLSSFIVTSAMGLWTAALILFDVKRPPDSTERKADAPATDKVSLPPT